MKKIFTGIGMNAIEIRDLVKTYKGKKRLRVQALKGLSLNIAKGEVFGFLGPNGAGKSTTIKLLLGLITPTSGDASIMGHKVSSRSARLNVGYLPENPAFFDFLTADEYLDFVGSTFRMDRDLINRKKAEVLTLLNLQGARKRPIRGYSKGMVQRLGLAQVMIHDPEVYILDEPMSGLDPMGRALVKNIILELKSRGKSVFFSTHITSDVESVCDRVGIILDGVLKRVERVDYIMSTGITGYTVQTKEHDGKMKETYLEKEQLNDFLSSQSAEGVQITLVEPKRKNLEKFFLDIVRGE